MILMKDIYSYNFILSNAAIIEYQVTDKLEFDFVVDVFKNFDKHILCMYLSGDFCQRV